MVNQHVLTVVAAAAGYWLYGATLRKGAPDSVQAAILTAPLDMQQRRSVGRVHGRSLMQQSSATTVVSSLPAGAADSGRPSKPQKQPQPQRHATASKSRTLSGGTSAASPSSGRSQHQQRPQQQRQHQRQQQQQQQQQQTTPQRNQDKILNQMETQLKRDQHEQQDQRVQQDMQHRMAEQAKMQAQHLRAEEKQTEQQIHHEVEQQMHHDMQQQLHQHVLQEERLQHELQEQVRHEDDVQKKALQEVQEQTKRVQQESQQSLQEHSQREELQHRELQRQIHVQQQGQNDTNQALQRLKQEQATEQTRTHQQIHEQTEHEDSVHKEMHSMLQEEVQAVLQLQLEEKKLQQQVDRQQRELDMLKRHQDQGASAEVQRKSHKVLPESMLQQVQPEQKQSSAAAALKESQPTPAPAPPATPEQAPIKLDLPGQPGGVVVMGAESATVQASAPIQTDGVAAATPTEKGSESARPEARQFAVDTKIGATSYTDTDGNTNIYLTVPKFTHKTRTNSTKSQWKSVVGQVYDNDLIGDTLAPSSKKGEGTEEEGEGEGEGESEGHIALLFFFMSLAIGSVLLMLLPKYCPLLPYTCALWLTGLFISLFHEFCKRSGSPVWATWSESVDMWASINPYTVFYTLLPPLIFGEAMRMNPRNVAQCFMQVFILAVPGVIIGTVLMGYFCYTFLPSEWSWNVSMLFGAVISATDPVAVVALFSTLGVSKRLSMLVSGESLLNDGTVIVLFVLLLKVIKGGPLDWQTVTFWIGWMTLVAVATGFILGGLGCLLIMLCAEEGYYSDAMIQVVVTLVLGFMTFFAAESELSTSGVVTTVTAGLCIAYAARQRFVSRETVSTVWEAVEFVANTVIFLLAGLLFGTQVMERLSAIDFHDLHMLVVLYLTMMLVRAIMVLLIWIPMNLCGKEVSWKEAVVMIWCGLRGAVSLCMATIVEADPKNKASNFIFYCGGCAALTCLINATTTGALLKSLGFTETAQHKKRFISLVSSLIQAETRAAYEEEIRSGADVRFSRCNKKLVCAMVPDLNTADDAEALGWNSVQTEEDEAGMLSIYRDMFLRIVSSRYIEMLDHGIVPRNTYIFSIFLRSCDEAREDLSEPLHDWDIISEKQNVTKEPTLGERLRSKLVDDFPVKSRLFQDYASSSFWPVLVTTVLCYMASHANARTEISKLFGKNQNDVAKRIYKKVCDESEQQCKKAEAMLSQIPAEEVELGKTKMLARRLLTLEKQRLGLVQEKGLITSNEAETLAAPSVAALRRMLTEKDTVWKAVQKVSS
eukprot:TRINITY_DN17769_c0_g3_i2.p1 TRINITY_DN17769_c0_g3~~TRINITY_DN17769_c0_g3_i2.p1  ORF type:complete len:1276 (-),score=313.83 TRINITY_DN17769_c0_g3_i2:105-3932(-)